jgi:hypothetical protein
MKIPKELQENTTKQVKELNKTILDLKMEIETINKSKGEILEIENLGKGPGVIDESITNRIQEIEVTLRCKRYYRNHCENSQRECKMQKAPNPTFRTSRTQ